MASSIAAAVLVQGLFPIPAQARRSYVRQQPQLRQILVVTANVEEVWNERDNADSSDLATFVRRLSRVVPHAPDVLLLQEVNRRSTTKVVKLLRRRTGRRYVIAVSAGKHAVSVEGGRAFTRETSIVINAGKMKMIGKPRFIETTHKTRHGKRGRLREVKRNVAALLRERRTGRTFPVANVHFHTAKQLRSDTIERRYRKIWARRVASVLKKQWPRYQGRAVIGGDFNAKRGRVKDRRKIMQAWWKRLIRRRFRDSVYEIKGRGGVDFIFTRTRIAAAGADWAYNPKEAAGTSSYYSDHKFRWALLGHWRPRARARPAASNKVDISWKALPSAKKIWIQRSRPGTRRWTVAARVRGSSTQLRDRRLQPTTRYIYRVIAWNGAEKSTPSRILRVRTRRDTLPPRQPAAPNLGAKVQPVNGKGGIRPKPVVVTLKWRKAQDRGGSGIRGYEVWRSEVGRDAKLITRTDRNWYVDRAFTKHRTVEYFVVAYDAVGNRSARSDAASVLPL